MTIKTDAMEYNLDAQIEGIAFFDSDETKIVSFSNQEETKYVKANTVNKIQITTYGQWDKMVNESIVIEKIKEGDCLVVVYNDNWSESKEYSIPLLPGELSKPEQLPILNMTLKFEKELEQSFSIENGEDYDLDVYWRISK